MSKCLTDEQLKAAYGEITSGFESKLDRTLTRLQKGEEIKVKKKVSLVLVLALVAILALGVAVATSPQILEVFNNRPEHGRNNALKAVSDNAVTQVQTIALDDLLKGAIFTVNQSYYDDTQLYFAYTIQGESKVYDYDYVVSPDEISAMEDYGTDIWVDYPEGGLEKINERLKKDGKAAVRAHAISLMDGLSDIESDRFSITESDEYMQDDELIGYRRFELTQAQAQKEGLSLVQQLTYHTFIVYYEGSDVANSHVYWLDESILRQDVNFEAKKNQGSIMVLEGERAYEDYIALATVTITPVDIRLDVALSGTEEWQAAMIRCVEMEEPTAYDVVVHYALLVNGERCGIIEGGMGANIISMRFDRPEGIMQIQLVPEYFESGENMDHAITIDAAS